MPERNATERLLKVLPGRRGWDEWDNGRREPEGPAVEPLPTEGRRFRPRRIAVTIALTAVFATGAAISAVAGDQVRGLADSSDPSSADAALTDTSSTSATTTTSPADPVPEPTTTAAPAPPPAQPAPVPAPDQTAMSSNHVGASPVASAPKAPAVQPRSAPRNAAARHVGLAAVTKQRKQPVATRRPQKVVKAPAPEIEGVGMPTVWLNSALPDPTPPSMRLTPKFAARLAATAKFAHVDWALMLGVLRVRGELGAAPAGRKRLRALAAHLADFGVKSNGWAVAFGLSGETAFADRTIALSHYYHAVGLRALVTGLEAAKPALEARVLKDQRLSIYSGGRHDVSSGRVDVRVLVLMEYLADTYKQVTVSCLISGHRLYARPGVISAHIYGRAVDIASLGGTSIAGHQGAGSLTEGAVKDILLLPPEVFPRQVISLVGLGGPSFPLANHWDHIHIGY